MTQALADRPKSAVGDSATVAKWTLASRVTGFLRVGAIAALLGPSYLGNLFQTINLLPWVIYDLAIGSMLASVLVPGLVAADQDEEEDFGKVAGALLSAVAVPFGLLTLVLFLVAPYSAELLAISLGSDAPKAEYIDAALPLLLLTAPQLLGYGVIALAVSIQNARGKFALPAAAPLFENVVVIVALVAFAVTMGTDVTVTDISGTGLLILGLGSSLGVVAHLAIQLFGVRRVNVRLRPGSLRHPAVTGALVMARPAALATAMNAVRLFVPLLLTASVPGGTVAFQLGQNLVGFISALGARSVVSAFLPRAAHLARTDRPGFAREYLRSQRIVLLLTIPASVGLLGLAPWIARGLAFGRMGTGDGPRLLEATIAGGAPMIVGVGITLVAVSSSYARGRSSIAVREMTVKVMVTFGFFAIAWFLFDGIALLAAIGVGLSLGDLAAARLAWNDPLVGIDVEPSEPRPSPKRSVTAAAVVFGPMAVVAWFAGIGPATPPAASVLMVVLVLLGAVAFFVVRWWLGPDEISEVVADLGFTVPKRFRTSTARTVAWPEIPRHWLIAGIAGSAVALTSVRPILLFLTVGGLATASLIWAVARNPVLAARIMIVAGPLVVGLRRDGTFGPLRANELLLAVVLLGVGIAVLRGFALPRWHRADSAVTALVLFGTFVPLVLAFGRGRGPTFDDILSAFTLLKGFALYVLFRVVHRSKTEVMRTVAFSLGTAALLSFIAVLDALNVGGIAEVLGRYFPSGDGFTTDDFRGSATIGNPIGFGGYLVMHLAVGLALVATAATGRYESGSTGERRWHRLTLAAIGIGVLATGQISVWMASTAAVVVLFFLIRPRVSATTVAAAIVAGLASIVLLAPVVDARVRGFDDTGIPTWKLREIAAIEPRQSQPLELYWADPGSSWDVRLHNLNTYFLPDLLQPANFVLGVRPEGRVEADEPWLEFVWIESGLIWLLYVGGIPFLGAFSYLTWRFSSMALQSWKHGGEPLTLAAAGVMAALAILMLFDPHLTIRGTSEALYPILALVVLSTVWTRAVPRSPGLEVAS